MLPYGFSNLGISEQEAHDFLVRFYDLNAAKRPPPVDHCNASEQVDARLSVQKALC